MRNINNDPNAPTPATYRGSENIPSMRTLAPVPSFPKLDATPIDSQPPASAQSPATLSHDRAGQVTGDKPGETLHLATRQITPSTLQPPTRFDPKLGHHVPVDPLAKDDSTSVTSRPDHRPLTGGI